MVRQYRENNTPHTGITSGCRASTVQRVSVGTQDRIKARPTHRIVTIAPVIVV